MYSISYTIEPSFTKIGDLSQFIENKTPRTFRDAITSTDQENGLELIKKIFENEKLDINSLIGNEITNDQESPLITSIRFGHYKIAFFLLDQGADPLVKDTEGRTAFFHIKMKYDQDEAMNLYREMLSKSSSSKEQIWSMRDCRNQTPLHTTVNFLTSEWLDEIKEGLDLDIKDQNGRTPLYFALGSPDIVKILIQNKATVNCVDNFNESPLSYSFFEAMRTGHSKDYYKSAQLLIEEGANIDETSLNAAYKYGRSWIPEGLALILLEKGNFSEQSVSKLAFALEVGLVDQVEMLLKQGENPNWSHPHLTQGSSLLDIAALNQDILNFFFLLEYGATWNRETKVFDLLRQGLAEIYLKSYSSTNDRHQAICSYLTDPEGKIFNTTLKKDYQTICKYFEIPENQRCRLSKHESKSKSVPDLESESNEMTNNLELINQQKNHSEFCILF